MKHSLPPRSCSVDIGGVGNSVQFTLSTNYLKGAVLGARDTVANTTQLLLSGNSEQRGRQRCQQIIVKEWVKCPIWGENTKGRGYVRSEWWDGRYHRMEKEVQSVGGQLCIMKSWKSFLCHSPYTWCLHSQNFQFNQKYFYKNSFNTSSIWKNVFYIPNNH